MATHLESKDLINTQQMEVAVNGPDGATHLILCTGIANLGSCSSETFTFFVGPQMSRRQFVGAITSGALSTMQVDHTNHIEGEAKSELGADLVSIDANYDNQSGRVKVSTEVASSTATLKLAISYNVSILAELVVL